MKRGWNTLISKLQKLQNESKSALNDLKSVTEDSQVIESHLSPIANEYHRVTEISKAPMIILDDIDSKFAKVTKLNSRDIKFLFLATALQILRQYLLTNFQERLSDSEAAESVKGDASEKSNRIHQWYKPTLEEIITNPVPFDANDGSAQYGALKGFGKLGHRGATPGHDPILGFVFGTANIATSTLTNWRMESYHIKTGRRDELFARAKTSLVFYNTFNKLFYEGANGKIKVAVSLSKEYIHLKSDLYSTNSLPFPVISAISPKFAGELANFGVDAANVIQVGRQMTYAHLINVLISILHGLFYDEAIDTSLNFYQARTRKILSYSNIIASTSNIILSTVTRQLDFLDIGGLAITLLRLITDTKFITNLKEEFLREEFYNKIVGSPYDFMEG